MELGENSRSKARTNKELNPYMAPESYPGHICGRRALLLLRHPCSPNKHLYSKLGSHLLKQDVSAEALPVSSL